MSLWAILAAWEYDVRGGPGVRAGYCKLVLLALADRADDAGRNAFPSVKRISERSSIDERTTKRVLKHLESTGVVIVREPATTTKPPVRDFGAWFGPSLEKAVRRVIESRGGGRVTPPRGGRVTPELSLELSMNSAQARSRTNGNGDSSAKSDRAALPPPPSPDDAEQLARQLYPERFAGGSDAPAPGRKAGRRRRDRVNV